MPPNASCCCPQHNTWGHSDNTDLRVATESEAKFCDINKDGRHKGRKRKICTSCRSRIQLETKYDKLQKTVSDALQGEHTAEHFEFDDPLPVVHHASTQTDHSRDVVAMPPPSTQPVTSQTTEVDPLPPTRPYQCYGRSKRTDMRSEIIERFHDMLDMYVHGDGLALNDLVDDLLQSIKWQSTFGESGKKVDDGMNSTFLSSLVKEYQECKSKETNT
ncbi:hypothetical protein ACROYT_G035188 [Oculina patagonica]